MGQRSSLPGQGLVTSKVVSCMAHARYEGKQAGIKPPPPHAKAVLRLAQGQARFASKATTVFTYVRAQHRPSPTWLVIINHVLLHKAPSVIILAAHAAAMLRRMARRAAEATAAAHRPLVHQRRHAQRLHTGRGGVGVWRGRSHARTQHRLALWH